MDTIIREASRNRDLPVEKRRILSKNETEEKDIAREILFLTKFISFTREKALVTLRKIVKYQFWNYFPLI